LSASEALTRLKWFLRLCKNYEELDAVVLRSDYYFIRYLLIIIRNIIGTDPDLYVQALTSCGKDLVERLSEVADQFLHAKYSYLDNATTLETLKSICRCLDKHTALYN